MIVATIASYPPRESSLKTIIEIVAPQVDRLNVVLNEYSSIPSWEAPKNVNLIHPTNDLKDTGKWLPIYQPHDIVLLADDDILYPATYVNETVNWLRQMPDDNYVVGYHGSIYMKERSFFKRFVSLVKSEPVRFRRKVFHFRDKLAQPIIVDQLGTGVLATWGKNMPAFDYMASSQKFVDVRFAKWCFSKKITQVCLPREDGWLRPIEHEESIWMGFTRLQPKQVETEIRSFAMRRANVGQCLIDSLVQR